MRAAGLLLSLAALTWAASGMVAGTVSAAPGWVYRSLEHAPSEVRRAEPAQLTYQRASAGDLTRLRFGLNPKFTRLVLEFKGQTRFIIDPVTERTIEITLLKLRPDQISDNLAPAAGLITAYRLQPAGAAGTKLIVEAAVPISIAIMGDIAPDDETDRFRLFFDFVEKDRVLAQPTFTQPATVAVTTVVAGASKESPVAETPAAVADEAPAAEEPGATAALAAAPTPAPRDEGIYLRAIGGFAGSNDTGDDIASVSDDAGNGWKASGAVGYRVFRFLRAEVEGGRFDGFEVENAAGEGDVNGWFTAVNSYLFLVPEFWSMQPYVGGGMGLSFNEVERIGGGVAPSAPSNDETSFLWQVMLGTEVRPLPNLAVDLGYRFADHGDIRSGKAANGITYGGDLNTHEIFFGLIYDF